MKTTYTILSHGAAQQIYGSAAKAGSAYFQPSDYEGDVPFSKPYPSMSAASSAARLDRAFADGGADELRLG